MYTKKLILLIFLSITLLLLDKLKLLTVVKSPLEDLVIPVQKNLYLRISQVKSVPINVRYYLSLGENMNQIRNLQQKKTELELKNALLTEENTILRAQLGAPLPPAFKFIPAAVIALSADMEINIGQKDGVREGMPVVFENYLIGLIKTAENSRSRVTLLTDRDISVPAKSNRGTRGIVTGGASGSIYFDKVLQKDALFMEDVVISSGEGGFPPNLLIGKISHITSTDVAVYKSALVDLGINLTLLTTVFVINNL